MKRLTFLATLVVCATFAGLCLAETDHAAMQKIAGLTDDLRTIQTNLTAGTNAQAASIASLNTATSILTGKVTALNSATSSLSTFDTTNIHITNKLVKSDAGYDEMIQSGVATNWQTISFTPQFWATPTVIGSFQTPPIDDGITASVIYVSSVSTSAFTFGSTPKGTTSEIYWIAIGKR